MADAPEVVPGSITPMFPSAISPAPMAPTASDEKSPGPPHAPKDQTTKAPRTADVSDEKEILQPEADEVSPKYPIDAQESPKDSKSSKYGLDSKAAPEADRKNQKYPVEEQDRTTPKYPVNDEASPIGGIKPDNDFAGCRGIDPGGLEDASLVDRRRLNTDDEGEDWHVPLCGCCSEESRSLCCEAAFMPCILAGRRYLRVKNTKPSEMTSTNAYCLGCFVFTVPLTPFWWVMGMSTRSEIRHKYGIRGSNKDDCMTHCFCAWCALVQEEKELLWHEEQRVGSGLDNGYRRGEQMVYSPAR
ncbi:PLAC8-domain-containing protein [Mytilinidion resinicola]|uniref:PLAC8-domain-containing protein n=1 Tax=Mytilinidion resinicola TaxID=574789 RepID=A0A6A6Z1T2_9PEZI|nr:PLAC8-domain-containing protein [Mytilinidion resinicola]KAF2814679.1 PLAC8-domain-containing protein [Mytilinidion resinicola]